MASAGARDTSVTIQQLTESLGPTRFPVETWSTLVATEWMAKQDVSGSEQLRGGGASAGFDTRWEMGYRSEMDPDRVDVPKTRRIVYLGRAYNIVRAVHLQRKRAIELLTTASSRVSA